MMKTIPVGDLSRGDLFKTTGTGRWGKVQGWQGNEVVVRLSESLTKLWGAPRSVRAGLRIIPVGH